MSSTVPSPDDPPEVQKEVLAALRRHRHALRAGDAAGVDQTLDRAARRPSERDLLVDLIAAEGLSPATRKLARFWRRVSTSNDGLRVLGDREVEVYERLALPGPDALPVVTLMRRGDDGTWRVVLTQRAPGESQRALLLASPAQPLCDTEISRELARRWPNSAELVVENGEGVLGHPREGWVAGVRPAADGWELSLEAAEDPAKRRAQIVWLSRGLLVLARHLEARAVWVPAARKLVGVESFDALAGGDSPPSQLLLMAWAAMHRNSALLYTAGLGAFGLPEIAVDRTSWGNERTGRRLVAGTALAGVGGGAELRAGLALSVGPHRIVLGPGPRGPTPGQTFGRHGAVAIRPPRSATVAESGVVRRV